MMPGEYLNLALVAAIGLLGWLPFRWPRTGYLALALIAYGSFAGYTRLVPGLLGLHPPQLIAHLWYAAGRIGLVWGTVLFLRPHLHRLIFGALAAGAALFSVALLLIIAVVTLRIPHPPGPIVPTFEGVLYLAITLAAWGAGRSDRRSRWVALAGLFAAAFRLIWLIGGPDLWSPIVNYLDLLALVALWPALWLRPTGARVDQRMPEEAAQ